MCTFILIYICVCTSNGYQRFFFYCAAMTNRGEARDLSFSFSFFHWGGVRPELAHALFMRSGSRRNHPVAKTARCFARGCKTATIKKKTTHSLLYG